MLCFADQQPPAIELPPESVEKLKEAYVQKQGQAHGEYQWVMVPDDKGDMYVLKWK